VHTDAVHWVVGWIARIQSIAGCPERAMATAATPPGTISRSHRSTWSNPSWASIESLPPSLTGPGRSATNYSS